MPIARELGDPDASTTFVLVHCAPGDSQVFHHLAPRLVDHGRVVLVDLPDAGGSEDLDAMDPEASVEDVRAVVARLARPVTLIGLSFGGWVCARLANRPPSTLDKLVVLAGLAGLPQPHADAYLQMARDLETDQMALSGLWDALIRQSFPTDAPREREITQAMVSTISKARAARTLRRTARLAESALEVERYDVPTILLHGRNDAVVPLAYGEALAARGTSARLDVLDTDQHLLALTHVDDCLGAILG